MFLRMKESNLQAGFDLDAFDRACSELPGGLRPVFATTRRFQADLLGVEGELSPVGSTSAQGVYAQPRSNLVKAELFTDGASLYLVEVLARPALPRRQPGEGARPRSRSYGIRLYCMSADPQGLGFDEVASALGTALGAELETLRYKNERFDELRAEGRAHAQAPAKDELAAARVLSDRATRTAAIAIKASAGLLVGDFPRQLGEARDRSDDVRQQLLASGLVRSEFVVICKKTSGQIARFPSVTTIGAVSGQGVKCACGRAIKDERFEEALTTTQFSADLLEHSRWFSLILIDELLRLGIPLEDMLLDVQTGGDEMDCLAVVSGELIFFELKDKEFNLGNAYSFGAKIGMLNPTRSVIVTTEAVGNDAKEHFQRAEEGQRRSRRMYVDDDYEPAPQPGSASVEYIEGLDQLRPALEALVSDIYSSDAAPPLASAARFVTPSPQALLRAVRPTPSGGSELPPPLTTEANGKESVPVQASAV